MTVDVIMHDTARIVQGVFIETRGKSSIELGLTIVLENIVVDEYTAPPTISCPIVVS